MLAMTAIAAPADNPRIPAPRALRANRAMVIDAPSPNALCRCLVLADIPHLDVLASALAEACRIGRDAVPFDEPIHEIEHAADRDGGMQGSLVPAGREDRVGIGLRHVRRRHCQLLHEGEQRPQLTVDRRGREVADEAIDRCRRDAKQFRRRAVPAIQYWQALRDETYAPISSRSAGVRGEGPRRTACDTWTQCE